MLRLLQVHALLIASLSLVACAPNDSRAAEGAEANLTADGGAAASTLPPTLHYFRNAAEQQAAVRQAFGLATTLIEAKAASHDSAKPWGVVTDADETIIDNSAFMKELAQSNTAYTPEGWTIWAHRKEAKAQPGAKSYLHRVHELGGKVVVVTNRTTIECEDTKENLRTVGLEFDEVLCRVDVSDKNPRFKSVAEGTASPSLPALDVLLFTGDNILDFPGLDQSARTDETKLADFGSRFVILPNVMYGSWEKNPQN